MTDNIVLFYLFFIVVGFFTAMLGTILVPAVALYLCRYSCTGSLSGAHL